jgi:hypothetical protein
LAAFLVSTCHRSFCMAVPVPVPVLVVDTYDDRQAIHTVFWNLKSELNPFQPHSTGKHRQFRVSGFLFHLDNPLGIGSDLLQSRVENHSRPDEVPKVPEHYEPRTTNHGQSKPVLSAGRSHQAISLRTTASNLTEPRAYLSRWPHLPVTRIPARGG